MTLLRSWAIAAVMITTMSIGVTGFITTGIAQYDVSGNVQDSDIDRLETLQNSTSIAQQAQTQAEEAEARSNFFTLPSIVNLLRLPFESIPIWQEFIGTIFDVTGLDMAPGGWPSVLAISVITIIIAFKFAGRVL